MASPVRRRRRRTARRTFARNPVRMATTRRNPIRRRRRVSMRRSYRRNPINMGGGGKGRLNLAAMFLPGIMVGAGAVGAEVLMGYLPLPSILTTGPQRYVTKGIISVAAGYFIAKYVSRKAGEAFATGGIAIAAHDAIKASLVGFMPSVKFGQYMGEYMDGYNWDKYGYNSPSVRSYSNVNPGIGYYNPGSTLNGGVYDQSEMAGNFSSSFQP